MYNHNLPQRPTSNISDDVVRKLCHEIPEIRLRALQTVESKLNRPDNANALEAAGLPHRTLMLKSLLRWFGLKPCLQPDRAMSLLLCALEQPNARESIAVLGQQKILKDLIKIEKLLTSVEAFGHLQRARLLVQSIVPTSNDHSSASSTTSLSNISIPSASHQTIRNDSSSISIESVRMSECNLNDDELQRCDRLTYEPSWQQPALADLKSMRLLNTALRTSPHDDDNGNDAFQHAIQFLGTAVCDLPAEYFLQPPYILMNLLALLEREPTPTESDDPNDAGKAHGCSDIVEQCCSIARALRKRILQRRLNDTSASDDAASMLDETTSTRNQITVSAFVGESLRCALGRLKVLIDASDKDEHEMCRVFEWLSALLDVGELCAIDDAEDWQNVSGSLRTDVGFLVRFFRQTRLDAVNNANGADNNKQTEDVCWQIADGRRTYVQLLDLMCRWFVVFQPQLSDRSAEVCVQELRQAVFDYSLRQHFNGLWSEVSTILNQCAHDADDEADENDDAATESNVGVLLSAAQALRPAITLLRNPNGYAAGDDPLLATALSAVDTLGVHQSVPLVRLVLRRIVRVQPHFNGNVALRENAERLLLRLLAHERLDVRRETYGWCAQQMKLYFGGLLDGSAMPMRTRRSLSDQQVGGSGVWLGVPLSVDVLLEVIGFGEPSVDVQIHENASAMLSLLLRSRQLLSPVAWGAVFELLQTALPLLQTAIAVTASNGTRTPLGDEILALLDPDNTTTTNASQQPQTTTTANFTGNIRLLFQPSASVRDEAIARLLYQLVSQPDAHQYLPRIGDITDVIPNDLCRSVRPWDAQAAAAAPQLYDPATLDSLAALLDAGAGVDAAVRRSTLVQLGCLLVDPQLCERFALLDGLRLASEAVYNACVDSQPNVDHTDAAIGAVAVLAKLCVHSADVRRRLAQDERTLRCVLRAMLVFVHSDGVRRDGALVLFLATHAGYVTGAGGGVTVPLLMQQRLSVPLRVTAHWTVSPYRKVGVLERVLDGCDPTGAEWAFVRYVWAEGMLDRPLSAEVYTIGKALKYPDGGLPFSSALGLSAADVCLLHASDPSAMLANGTRRMANATSHADVLAALDCLSRTAMLPATKLSASSTSNFIKDLCGALRRFFAVPPNTLTDHRCFERIMYTLRGLVAAPWTLDAFEPMLVWLLEQMRRKNCPLLGLLRADGTTTRMFGRVCAFVRRVWQWTFASGDSENVRHQAVGVKVEAYGTLLEYYYETVVSMLDERFERRELDKLRSLLALLRCLTTIQSSATSTLQLRCIDAEAATFVANKLLRFVATIRSLAQTGAAFNRNCLRSVANVLQIAAANGAEQSTTAPITLGVRNKYVRLLSGLCGHTDLEVRTLAWCVLAECALSYDGADQLVHQLAYLPGGFHACCLSTFLDAGEASVVRCTAGTVFGTLLGHVDDRRRWRQRRHPKRVLQPLYGTDRVAADECDAVDESSVERCTTAIFELLACHRFAATMADQLADFWTTQQKEEGSTANRSHTSWCVVRTFCSISRQLVRLCQSRAVHDLRNAGTDLVCDAVRILPAVQQIRSTRGIQMLAEVCAFVAACCRHDAQLPERLTADEPAVMAALMAAMDPAFYAGVSDELRAQALGGVLRLLVPLTCKPIVDGGGQKEGVEPLVHLLRLVLRSDIRDGLVRMVLTVLRNRLQCDWPEVPSSNEDDGCRSFGELLDAVVVPNGDNNETAAAECFRLVYALWSRAKSSTVRSPEITQTMALLLQHCRSARTSARSTRLMTDLLDDLDAIFQQHLNGTTTCAEFVRRFGDAKKEPILATIRNNVQLLLYWFSRSCLHLAATSDPNAPADVNTCGTSTFDALLLRRLTGTVVRLWPWSFAGDQRLQLAFVRMLAYASEDSLPVCQLFASAAVNRNSSSNNSATAITVLQLCADFVVAETAKPKAPGADLRTVEIAMRVVSNCCACAEGRQALLKSGFLDAMDRLHPAVTKWQRPWPAMAQMWLGFYEILTRYAATNGTGVKHLSLLCTLIHKPAAAAFGARLRMLALTIVRNMSFAAACRPAMCASDELMYAFKVVLECSDDGVQGKHEQQLLVCTTIWRLIANNYRAKHALRAASLPARLASLADRLGRNKATDEAEIAQQSSRSELQFTLEVLRLLFDK